MQTNTFTVHFAPLRPARQLIVAALAGVPQLFTYDAAICQFYKVTLPRRALAGVCCRWRATSSTATTWRAAIW